MPVQFPECKWKPNVIRRQVNAVKSSTLVVEVETDDGLAFVKGVNNPAGNESLSFELVGTRLARAIGLDTPEFAILDHDFLDLVRFDASPVPMGPVFASKAISGSTGGERTPFLEQLVNPEAVPLLVAFDTWISNFDRCPPPDYLDPTPNWDNVFFVAEGRRFRLIVFDHTHCFAEGELDMALENNGYRDDLRVFGKFPEFNDFLSEGSFLKALENIHKVDVSTIEQIIDEIPEEWELTFSARDAWIRQIVERRDLLEELILADLSAQMRLKL
ncbi:HipA family kinase [Erythrobacter sp. F6033]|uniref:HipA family kinase n=1 Tax=Erythrobacter sp. F6033 TaxID=2926401 RepID=UPI001FF699D3|nr:HipA family kinase [Erythrobacter sp. F6033]MCK0127995.1 hypothetical protein [Erythrobacter sp. F6033]